MAAFGQRNFETPDAAAQALIDAAESNNTPTLNAIFGSGGGAFLNDKAARDEFASIAKNRRRLQSESGRVILMIGSEDWPFPIPVVGAGAQWHFDPSQSESVIAAHRLRADELDAIELCASYVGAQRQFAQQHGMQQYAQRFEELGNLIATQPYRGYNFRMLQSQGSNASGGSTDYIVQGTMLAGFGLVATPAEYGVSGTHTFIVSQDGIVYQKDLGASPPQITKFDPDPSWKPVY
jgi:hypothetical protein